MSSETGEAKRKTVVTKTTAARASGRWNKPKSQVSSDRAEGEYYTEGTSWEESAEKSAEWSGNDTGGWRRRSRLLDFTFASDILALTKPQISEYSCFSL